MEMPFLTHSKANQIRIKLIVLTQKDGIDNKKFHQKQTFPNQKFFGEMLINSKLPSEIFKPPMIKVEVLNEEYNEATISFKKDPIIDIQKPESKHITNSSLKLRTKSSYSVNKMKKGTGSIELSVASQNDSLNPSDNEYKSQYNDLYKIKRRRKNKMKYNTPLIDKCALITDRDLFSEKKALNSYLLLKHLAIKLSINKRKDNEKFINFDALRAKTNFNSTLVTNQLIRENSNNQEGKFVVIKPKDSPHKSCHGLIKLKNSQGQKKSFTINLEKSTNLLKLPNCRSNKEEAIKEVSNNSLFILTPKVNRQQASVRFVNVNQSTSGNKMQSIPLVVKDDKESVNSKDYSSSSTTSPIKQPHDKKLNI